MDSQNFSKEIKELRLKKGLSQEELASLSGLSLRTIQRIEKGETNPHGDTKRKIINILETYPDAEFSRSDVRTNKSSLLRRFATNLEYLLLIFMFSLLSVLLGMFALNPLFLISGFFIGFICVIALAISSARAVWTDGWKKGLKYFSITVGCALIYLLPLMHMTLARSVSTQTINDVTTRIETNLITGKSDTTITITGNKERINDIN
ncbi:helix-turn-helix domain-containing protein [Mangrovibacterium diazotrophicum]|uniref:Helix-turn-helix protein n=1 Tax=Mangrovibacterium diazotrophicum TaxID=1261403 RepID=A0A419W777_9BACT|nr:helix-turn-helix domain-containing protein [Mangrovibacterium diazotrophicum]RKD91341.1 helix-turn-helix protein [Mangrovibacterium diazotrophicum]